MKYLVELGHKSITQEEDSIQLITHALNYYVPDPVLEIQKEVVNSYYLGLNTDPTY